MPCKSSLSGSEKQITCACAASSGAGPHQSQGPAYAGVAGDLWPPGLSHQDRACRFGGGGSEARVTAGPLRSQSISTAGAAPPHGSNPAWGDTARCAAIQMIIGFALPLALAGCGTFGPSACSEPIMGSPGGSPCNGLVPRPAAATPAVGWSATAATPGAPYDPSLLLPDQVEAINPCLDQVEQRLHPPVAPAPGPRRTP